MKTLITLLSLVTASATFANLVKLDPRDIESLVLNNGNEIQVQDIQDGFIGLRGVYADEESLVINTTKLNGIRSIRFGGNVEMAMGGDMGGGGMKQSKHILLIPTIIPITYY